MNKTGREGPSKESECDEDILDEEGCDPRDKFPLPLIDEAYNGRLHYKEAERIARDHGLRTLETEPDSFKFNPMTKSTWTWFMVIGWICWRTYSDVRRCSDDYRVECIRWRPHQAWVSANGGRSFEEVSGWELRSDKPMTHSALSTMAAIYVNRLKVPIEAAERCLIDALTNGELVASAMDTTSGLPVDIPARRWSQIEVNDNGDLRFENTGAQVAFRAVKFLRTEVIQLWRADDDFVQPAETARDLGGRPPEFNWDEMKEFAVKLVQERGFPNRGNKLLPTKAQLKEAVIDFYTERYDLAPADSTVREKVNEWLEELKRG